MSIISTDGTETFKGLVLSSHNWYNSSMDVNSYYVTVYNVETGNFESMYVNNDFDSNVPQAKFTIDATPEVQAIWKAKQEASRKAEYDRQELIAVMTPARGKRLQVFKGRKVPIGTTGVCFWTGNNGWGESVGIKDDSGTVHFTAVTNVQVI